jgi:DNA-binding phage protein
VSRRDPRGAQALPPDDHPLVAELVELAQAVLAAEAEVRRLRRELYRAICEAVGEGGLSPTQAAAAAGLSRPAIYRALGR